MRTWKILIALSALGLATGCTSGAPGSSSDAVASGVLVGESLIKYGQTSSQFGTIGGFSPGIVVVAHGTTVQFHNEDSFNHTASSISAASFPSGNPIQSPAQTQSGSAVSQPGWSSGVLTPDAFSQPLQTPQTGTFLFGCFYHYPLMRGVIIVQ
jgi:plastocyanin